MSGSTPSRNPLAYLGIKERNPPNISVRVPRDPSTTDFKNIDVGDLWQNTSSYNFWILVNKTASAGTWEKITHQTEGDVNSLTGNSGGPVFPDPSTGNINILGSGTTTVVGNPSTDTLTITPSAGGYPISPFVVGPVGQAGYQTIQAALNAANTAGGGSVYVQPGTYTENLTLYDNTQVVGALGFADTGDLIIVGVHTPPATGGFIFRNVTLQSATHIFSSAVAGSAHLIIGDAAIIVTNGYTFNLANWTGKLEVFDVNDRGSTNDGFVNNTGGSEVALFSSAIGKGTVNVMIVSGITSIFTCDIGCPINFVTGSQAFLEGNVYTGNLTFSNNSTGEIVYSEIDASITMSSSGSWLISETAINSSTNPVISGAGAGALTINSISFIDNSSLAGTLNVSVNNSFRPTGLLVSTKTAGSPVSTVVSHTDNTAANNGANFTASVAGTTQTGDAYNLWAVGSTRSFSLGPDTSDSQIFKLTSTNAATVTPSTGTTVFTIDPSNFLTTFTAGQLYAERSSATDVSIQSRNTNNASLTAHASLASSSGGGAGGDAYVSYNILAVTDWISGIDNSDSDKWKISASAVLGTSDVLTITTAGTTTVTLGDFSVSRAQIGAYTQVGVLNTDATNTSSSARMVISTQSGGGDPYILWDSNAGANTSFEMGMDASASNLFQITARADTTPSNLNGNVIFQSTLDGEITKPLQPAFLATHTVDQNNVTGNSASVTVNFTTEVFDQNSDYDGINTFTAPITGRYFFNCSVRFDQLDATATSGVIRFITTARNYQSQALNYGVVRQGIGGVVDALTLSHCCFADMTSGNTCTVQVEVIGMAGNTVDILNDSTSTYFGGYLVC